MLLSSSIDQASARRGGGGGGGGGDRGGGRQDSDNDRGRGSAAESSPTNSGNSNPSGSLGSSNGAGNSGASNSGTTNSGASNTGSTSKSGDSQDTGNGKSRGGKGADGASGSNANQPPRTLAETFDRLFNKPADKKTEDTSSTNPTTRSAAGTASPAAPGSATAPTAGSPSITGTASAARAATSVRRAQTPVHTNPHYAHTSAKSHIDNEVLGVGLDRDALRRVEGLGFTVSKLAPPVQGTAKVTHLVPPAHLTLQQALDTLAGGGMPHQFGLNKLYRIYRTATVDATTPARKIQPAGKRGSAAPCQADRCAPKTLIGWNDDLQKCSATISIGIIDTGVDLDHPALETRKIRQETFIPAGTSPAPPWHGTGVATILAGDPKGGTPGLTPHAEFYVAEIFFQEDNGAFATDTASLVNALEWMGQRGVQIVNMSFSGPRDGIIEKQIAALSAKGVMLVAAAGNQGPAAEPAYPAAYKQVVAVTAVTPQMRNFAYANRGNHIDIAAPGVDIWTAVPSAREGYYSGTSFAAPYVTGVLATLHQASRKRDKETNLGLVVAQDLGTPGRDPIYGRGLMMAPTSCRPGDAPALAQMPTVGVAARGGAATFSSSAADGTLKASPISAGFNSR